MEKVRVSIVGGSGYVGGEALRLLLDHPRVEVHQITSESNKGKFVHTVHPNLRKRTQLKFCSIDDLEPVDTLFVGLPHGLSMKKMANLSKLAKHIIDKSADFRLTNPEDYKTWYKHEHINPELLKEFVYGLPELHREEIKNAKHVAAPGCNATATILPLYPLYKAGILNPAQTVVEVRNGTSEGGNKSTPLTHHPEARGAIRTYNPASHRHQAEILQELNTNTINFTATRLDIVRGIHMTAHIFLNNKDITEKDIWKIYRDAYGDEPFVRIVKERMGCFKFPDPKIVMGSNYCDIGFELDQKNNRLLVIAAIDNLMKGAAGQAVQAFNILHNFEETAGLTFPGLHPV